MSGSPLPLNSCRACAHPNATPCLLSPFQSRFNSWCLWKPSHLEAAPTLRGTRRHSWAGGQVWGPICSCLSRGTAVPSRVSDASVPNHLCTPTSSQQGCSEQEACGIWDGSQDTISYGGSVFLTWGAGGADTPPLLFFPSHSWPTAKNRGSRGSFPALPRGLHSGDTLAPSVPWSASWAGFMWEVLLVNLSQPFLVCGK